MSVEEAIDAYVERMGDPTSSQKDFNEFLRRIRILKALA